MEKRFTGLIALVVAIGLLIAGRGAVTVTAQGSQPPATGTNWHVEAGTATADSEVFTMAYYPGTITIDAGDSITWSVAGDAHTVSFLSGAQAPSPNDPTATAPAGGTTYDGAGIVSSGLLFPAVGDAPSQTYTLTFTAPGTYTYQCLIHPGMVGTVVVQPAGTPYPITQAEYDAASSLVEASDLAGAVGFVNTYQPSSSTNQDGTTTYTISAGLGNGKAGTMRFLPSTLVIHAGDSVSWSNLDPMEIHTVTFAGSDGKISDYPDPAAVAPAGGSTEDGSVYTNSGVIPPTGTPGAQPYTLTFPKPGVYEYVCTVHDAMGMKGLVIVLNNDKAVQSTP